MPFLLLLKPFNYLTVYKFGLRFGDIFFSKLFKSVTISSFLFDIFNDDSENIFLLLTIVSDITLSVKPRFFFFKHIYRGKSKAKIIVIKTFLKQSIVFRSLLKELFLFIFSRFFLLLKQLKISVERLLCGKMFSSFFFLIFTLPAFVFNYIYEDIDPISLRGFKINFVLSVGGKVYWLKEFFTLFLSCFFTLILNLKIFN